MMSQNNRHESAARSRQFIGEEIEMLETAEGGRPVRLRFRNQEHCITEVRQQWQDFGFSAATFKKSWRNRRHRNYYEVLTDQGRHFLIYFDRGVKMESRKKWVVVEEFSAPESA